MDEFRRNLAEELDIRAPVVDAEKFLRHRSEHSRDLFGLHSSMRTQSRQNRLKVVAKIFPRVARQIARAECTRLWSGGTISACFRSPSFARLSTSRACNSCGDRSVSTPPVSQ